MLCKIHTLRCISLDMLAIIRNVHMLWRYALHIEYGIYLILLQQYCWLSTKNLNWNINYNRNGWCCYLCAHSFAQPGIHAIIILQKHFVMRFINWQFLFSLCLLNTLLRSSSGLHFVVDLLVTYCTVCSIFLYWFRSSHLAFDKYTECFVKFV